MKVWLVAGVLALVFIGAGVFFVTRDSLSEMDQFASIGSFLLALVALAVAAIGRARARTAGSTGAEQGVDGSRFVIGSISEVGQLNVGDNNFNRYGHDGDETRPASGQ